MYLEFKEKQLNLNINIEEDGVLGLISYVDLVKGILPMLENFYENVTFIKIEKGESILDIDKFKNIKNVEKSLYLVILLQQLINKFPRGSERGEMLRAVTMMRLNMSESILIYELLDKAIDNVYKPLCKFFLHEEDLKSIYEDTKKMHTLLEDTKLSWINIMSEKNEASNK